MLALPWLEQPAAWLATAVLLHFLWQGALIAVALLAFAELGGQRRLTSRYAGSVTALISMALCPVSTAAWLAMNHPAARHVAHDFEEMADFAALVPAEPSARPAIPFAGQPQERFKTAQPYLLAAWFVGVSVLGGRLLLGAVGVARLRRGRLPLPVELRPLVAQLGHRLNMNALPLVGLSGQVAGALAVGVLRPLVLLPAAWVSEMPVELLEAVIAHELAHLRRRDLWVNLLLRIVETLLFYHPAVWWLSRRLELERELCADELAIAVTGKRLAYAQALEHVAVGQQADFRPVLAALMRGETNMQLVERVRYVLGQRPLSCATVWPAGIVAIAIPAALWLALLGSGAAVADDDRPSDKAPKNREEQAIAKELAIEVVLATDSDVEQEVRRQATVKRPKSETADQPERNAFERQPKPRTELREAVEERKSARSDSRPVIEVVTADNRRDERQIEELAAMVTRLSAQVERLSQEVADLRHGGSPSDPFRKTSKGPAAAPYSSTTAPSPAAQPAKRATVARAASPAKAAAQVSPARRYELIEREVEKQAEGLERQANRLQEQAAEQQEQAAKRAVEAQRRAVVERERVGEPSPGELKSLLQRIETLLRDQDAKWAVPAPQSPLDRAESKSNR